MERLDEDKAIVGFAQQAEARLVRWLDFAKGALLFLMVPGDSESGTFYVYDRDRSSFYPLIDAQQEDRRSTSTRVVPALLRNQ